MSLTAALAGANQWLDEVRGVHLVGSGRDDSGDVIMVFVDGPADAYLDRLPRSIEGIRVVIESHDPTRSQEI